MNGLKSITQQTWNIMNKKKQIVSVNILTSKKKQRLQTIIEWFEDNQNVLELLNDGILWDNNIIIEKLNTILVTGMYGEEEKRILNTLESYIK